MAKVIRALEAHPFSPYLSHENPFEQTLSCLLEHSPETMPPSLAYAIKGLSSNYMRPFAVKVLAGWSRLFKYLMTTSQGMYKVLVVPNVFCSSEY